MESRDASIGSKDTRECVLKAKVEAVMDKETGRNYDYDSLKTNVKEHLLKIESIIEDKFIKRDEATIFLKSHKAIPFSPTSIAEELDMSRNTIYRNNVLLHYIEHYDAVFKEDNPYIVIDELKCFIAELQAENTKLKHEAIDTEILRHTIREQETEILEKTTERDAKDEQIQLLQAEKYKLETTIAKLKSSSNVKQFSP